MRRIALLSCCAATALIACNNGNSAVTTPGTASAQPSAFSMPEIVAEVDGQTISRKELETAAAPQLSKIQSQVYEAYKVSLDNLIGDKLLEKAAKTAGKTPEAYMKGEIDEQITPASEAELKKFYEQRKAQMGGKKFDEIKPQIEAFLANQQRQQLQQKFALNIKKDAAIKTYIEPPRVKIDAGKSPSKGPEKAPIQIVEFSDYQCPFCGRSRATVKKVLETYGDKVRYTFRDFPLSFHDKAFKAHEAAHCANEQGKYWEMNTVLFEQQQDLSEPKLKEYAKTVGLDGAKFDACLGSGKFTKQIHDDMEAAQAVGVSGTPSFFVNGIPLSGARPFDDFKKIIDAELAKR
ncbi:MAG: thioredoxin domain-containing protein [Deltaproteobacteria bacterium]|nr:thioredoxin domain-containing protein [Deltaproteobacteria bacterium]